MPSVAIIGASHDAQKYGHAAVLAFLEAGWTVYPVNPRETSIAGLRVFSTIAEVLPLSGPLDWISLYVPSKVGLELLADLQKSHAKQIWLNPGTESDELVQAAKERGLPIVTACSIRALGKNPADYF